MRSAERKIACAALLVLASCRTRFLDEFGPLDGGAADQTMIATPPDLAQFNEDAACIPEDPNMGGPGCPCGVNGLCRPATGRLSVQTQAANGSLRIEVMDDNGCRKTPVATDHPIGVPRWAPDRERLAYLTANQESTLHLLRVDASGTVVCRVSTPLSGLKVTEVAWADDDRLWLFGPGEVVQWTLATGQAQVQPIAQAARFDAVGDGPLVVVLDDCGPMCKSRLDVRAQVLGTGSFIHLLQQATNTIGPVRLSPSGKLAVFELFGATLVPLDGSPPTFFGVEGDRSPAFALRGQAIVYATDTGQLKYHFLDGSVPLDPAIPPDWSLVYSPDWSPAPKTCSTVATCM